MPEHLADAAIFLGAALLFAWFACAFAQFAALAPGWARRAPARVKPPCTRNAEPSRHVLFSISFALLVTVTPGVLAALFTGKAVVVAAAQTGALVGLWLAARCDLMRRSRLITVSGCALGLAATGASVVCMLLPPFHTDGIRAALYMTAMLGALTSGAASIALCMVRDMRRLHRKRVPLGRGERMLHYTAFALIGALGVAIVLEPGSMEFTASALGAACVLAAALGARLMGGARRHAHARIAHATHDVSKRSAPERFVVVPDAWLVAACGPAAYQPTDFDTWLSVYEPPAQAVRTMHHASRDSPRRRRRSHRIASIISQT
ncbi:MAG TPA: hypothetical protein VG320_10735 [Paraburkholderia sp.]|jgi:hypothetical protein|uniref:hypothetical protein n=1 Tax=Paraburkholderia sp. TaxID=1926495 RepID=UPI002DF474FD|nr:hypothetical protein [Paraburkholderia sp.]